MRKLILAAVAAGILSIVAVAIAAAHDDHGSGEWPTSCVDLNDIVEAHLGNDHNVGIYQRTFGDQAEQACQNDHRNDVIAVFGWAIASDTGGQAEAADLELDWPTTCVELNDIVEGHLGNQGNVAIYQNTFGDQAEAACQNDHRNDVRSVFAWAIGTTDTAPPAPTPAPTPEPAPQPTPPPTTGGILSVAEYAEYCGQVESDINITDDPNATWGTAANAWAEWYNAMQAVTPPLEVSVFHVTRLALTAALQTLAASMNAADPFNVFEIFGVLLTVGGPVEQATNALPADIEAQLEATGCLG